MSTYIPRSILVVSIQLLCIWSLGQLHGSGLECQVLHLRHPVQDFAGRKCKGRDRAMNLTHIATKPPLLRLLVKHDNMTQYYTATYLPKP